MSTGPGRVPTGVLDHELRVVAHADGPLPTLQIQAWRRSPAAGWVPTEQPPALQAQFVERLCEVLRQQALATTAAERGEHSDSAPIRIPLGADLELRFTIIVGEDGYPAVEAGLLRARPNDLTREFHATSARWRVAGHLWPLVVEATQRMAPRLAKIAQRNGERSLFASVPDSARSHGP